MEGEVRRRAALGEEPRLPCQTTRAQPRVCTHPHSQTLPCAAAVVWRLVLGLSILSGSHMELLPKIRSLLEERGLGHVLRVAGGIIPSEDAEELRKTSWGMVFGPGTSTVEIAEAIEAGLKEKA